MKSILLTTIAAVLLVGCGESQQSSPPVETQPTEPIAEVPVQPSSPTPEAEPAEPVAKAAQPEPPIAKAEAPVISIHDAAMLGNIEAVKQHLAAGADVNAKANGKTPLDLAITSILFPKGHPETIDLLRKHGGKTGEELKAEGK